MKTPRERELENRTAVGRGKLILFGEHAAVYGYPAVGTPLSCTTEIGTGEFSPRASNGETGLIQELISDAADFTENTKWSGGPLYQYSDVPRAGGFGSSAALCVAVSRLVLGQFSSGYKREVHLLANRLEARFHGTPSGIDTGMASDTSAAAWLKADDDIPERRPLTIPGWSIIYGALPRSRSTAESVGKLRLLKESGDSRVMSSMEELGRISSEFIQAAVLPGGNKTQAADNDFSAAAAALTNEAQSVLSSLGLSTIELDTIFKTAFRMGAAGGKLSGSGMGGAFYIAAGDRHGRDLIIEDLAGELTRRGIKLSVPLTPLDFGSAQPGTAFSPEIIHEPEIPHRKLP